MNRRTVLAAAGTAMLVALGGCTASSHGQAAQQSARAAASSLAANPAYQQDKARLEAELLANFKKEFKASHPITSMMTAVRDTFPNGDSSKIVNYAVQTFKLADAKGQARQGWIQGVVVFALNQGATGVPSGTASIPGVLPTATPS